MLEATRQTLRRLFRAPSFSLTAIATLALGVAANVAVFSVLKAVVLEPLPFEDPEELVGLWYTAPGLGFDQINQSAALHQVQLEDTTTFASVGMWNERRVALTGTGPAEEVNSLQFSSEVLPLLRVDASLGRRFATEDDQPDSALTVMVSHQTWQRRFEGDRSVLGSTVRINGTEREIIGVLPEHFDFLDRPFEFVLPLRVDMSELILGQFNYLGLGRLAEGVTVDQANTAAAHLLPLAAQRYPGGVTEQMLEQAQFAPILRPLAEDMIGNVSEMIWILFAAVGLVLFIACANVANLFLVRAEARQRELAVRTAMGAGRSSLASQLLGESVALGVLAGALGVPLAAGLLAGLRALEPGSLPRVQAIGIDPGVLLFALAVSLLAGVVFGIGPALRPGVHRTSRLISALKEGGRGGAGDGRSTVRAGLVVSQVAIGVVLLIGSGLLLRSFDQLRQVDLGVQSPESLFTFRIGIPEAEVTDDEEAFQLQRRLLEDLATIPGVERVAGTSSVLLSSDNSNDALAIEEFPVDPGDLPAVRRFKFVHPGYFATMGNPLLAGRDLEAADLTERRNVAVVTADLVADYWSSPEEALGKRISSSMGDSGHVWFEIVGVVDAVHDNGPARPTQPTVYWPAAMSFFWGQENFVHRPISFVLRSERAGQTGLLQDVQEVVWRHHRNLPLANIRTIDQDVHRSTARSSFAMVMLAIAASLALLIGAVGTYGVIAYIVAQRRREFGVRLALGATRSSVQGLVARYGLLLGILGTILGLGLATGLSRITTSFAGDLLFGVDPLDPLTFGVVSILLLAICAASTLLAGRRAAGIEPVEALRSE